LYIYACITRVTSFDIQSRAAYIMCPCCVGNLANRSTLQYPLSSTFSAVLTSDEYAALAKAADFGHRTVSEFTSAERQRRVCKSFVERDRCVSMLIYVYA
jgi:hypothetical protein